MMLIISSTPEWLYVCAAGITSMRWLRSASVCVILSLLSYCWSLCCVILLYLSHECAFRACAAVFADAPSPPNDAFVQHDASRRKPTGVHSQLPPSLSLSSELSLWRLELHERIAASTFACVSCSRCITHSARQESSPFPAPQNCTLSATMWAKGL